MEKVRFNTLFWKITLILFGLLLVMSFVFLLLTAKSANRFSEEANQHLNKDVAAHIANELEILSLDSLNNEKLDHIFHNAMVLHPAIEIYFTDTLGNIKFYSAPDSLIKNHKIDMEPVKNLLEQPDNSFEKGSDPRNPGEKKVFSVSPIQKDEALIGYVYVVLTGQKFAAARKDILINYILNISAKTVALLVFTTFLIGTLAIYYLTENLNKVIEAVRKFQQGDFNSRIQIQQKGEIQELANTFNDMANTISKNIQKIEAIERSRRELVANVSHDLKTPLSTIKGFAETLVLKEKELNDEQKQKYIQIILNNTGQLKILVDQLFQLSKLESNEVEPDMEPFSLNELLQDNVLKYGMIANKKGIAIKSNIPVKLSFVYGDIGLIDRVIQNLMDNAIKFTNNGGEVHIGVKEGEEKVKIWVADTGDGIPSEKINLIFRRYQKGVHENGLGSGGIGLGLDIVRKILELHQSQIDVESKPGEGAVFSFELDKYEKIVQSV
ncbi:HAMP domain-containing sensor histidine kinase [Echinicola jeungdonensis]|uniref:histidine kinase n=1 Tax=Echinicola jeungdonensis TaxID=709343 RepID=A0ABV5J956_9BACT|nr:HAMP domain-containing sensor histidine kinase [Echinicola jeungdonensis]MDN3669290.1 HAMP domain-containing sensor histidine kinase [Echinicola jeungdonensis]